MSPEACRERIDDLNAQLTALGERRQELEGERSHFDVSDKLNREVLAEILEDFGAVFKCGATPQKKHLLHQLVKEVRVHSRLLTEVWYAFPQPCGSGGMDRTQPHMAPRSGQYVIRLSDVVVVWVRVTASLQSPISE